MEIFRDVFFSPGPAAPPRGVHTVDRRQINRLHFFNLFECLPSQHCYLLLFQIDFVFLLLLFDVVLCHFELPAFVALVQLLVAVRRTLELPFLSLAHLYRELLSEPFVWSGLKGLAVELRVAFHYFGETH